MTSSPYGAVAALLYPGSTLEEVDELPGGISAQMIRLTLRLSDGAPARVVLRRQGADALAARPDAMANEFRLLQWLHHGGLPVPEPLLLDERRQLLPQPYTVLAYVNGRMSLAPTQLTMVLDQMAATLTRIHQSMGPEEHGLFNLVTVPACSEQQRTGGEHTRLYRAALDALSARGDTGHPNQPTLLHGDYWPGNTLWHNDRLIAVIDWEDAAWGDPLIDIARTRSELVWIYGRQAMERFTEIYRRHNRLDWRDLPYWDLCAGLRQLRFGADGFDGVAAYFADYGRADLTGSQIEQELTGFITRAIDKLTEACST